MSMQLFVPITKVDATRRLVFGTIAEEVPDKAGEVFDYRSSKPYFEQWSSEIARASEGKSVGNLRAMHGAIAAGKLSALSFDDEGRRIEAVGKVIDDAEWAKVVEGVYTGFSIGGHYVERWPDETRPALTRYTAQPVEVSLVDNPCIPSATFSIVKTDGTVERRRFKASAATGTVPAPIAQASDAIVVVSGAASLVASGQPRQIWDCGIAGHAHLAKADALRCMELPPTSRGSGERPDAQSDPGSGASDSNMAAHLAVNLADDPAAELWTMVEDLTEAIAANDLSVLTHETGEALAPAMGAALGKLASSLDRSAAGASSGEDQAAASDAAVAATRLRLGALGEMLARRDRAHRIELAKGLDTREAAYMLLFKQGDDRLAALDARLAALEAQPAPAQGRLKAIEKGEDFGGLGDEASAIDPTDTLALIKQAQRNPKRLVFG